MSNVVPVKSKVKISQTFVAFSEYMNFTTQPNASDDFYPLMPDFLWTLIVDTVHVKVEIGCTEKIIRQMIFSPWRQIFCGL